MLVGINNKRYKINLISKSNLRWLRKQIRKPTTTLNYVAGRTWYMIIPEMWNYIAKQIILEKIRKKIENFKRSIDE